MSKDPFFLTIASHLSEARKKCKWYEFHKKKVLDIAICSAYLDYQGHHELADNLFENL